MERFEEVNGYDNALLAMQVSRRVASTIAAGAGVSNEEVIKLLSCLFGLEDALQEQHCAFRFEGLRLSKKAGSIEATIRLSPKK